jgi:hypothetical protein
VHVEYVPFSFVQVTEESLAMIYFLALEELSIRSLEELAASDEEDSGATSEDSGTAEELVCNNASEELSGSIPASAPVTPVEESESLAQLAQKKPAIVTKPKRKNLRIFIQFSFFSKYIQIHKKGIICHKKNIDK